MKTSNQPTFVFRKCEECENVTENNERLQGDMSILSKTMTVIETKLEHVEKDLARYGQQRRLRISCLLLYILKVFSMKQNQRAQQ